MKFNGIKISSSEHKKINYLKKENLDNPACNFFFENDCIVNVILAKSKEDLYQVDKKICMNFQFKDDDIRFEKFQYFPKKENIRTKNDNDDRQDDSPKNSPKKQNTHIKKNDSDDDEQDNSPKNSPKKKQNTHIKKNDSDDDEQDDSPKNILKKEQNFPNNIDELDIFIDEENIGYLNNISISNNLENLIKKK